jgi:stage II sporulation protein D
MRGAVRGGLYWALVLVSVGARAAPVDDGGGRDVSIALFSTRSLHRVTVTPLGRRAWTAKCARCAQEPMTSPLLVTGAVEVFAGGKLRVTDDASGDVRSATGLWHLRGSGPKQEVDVVLTLPSEAVVAAVLGAEAATSEPAQSLQALAILARTYALNGSHFTAGAGHLTADLCDSTQCQAMLLGSETRAVEDAVRDTAGETLWFEGRRAEVYFSQDCWGVTEEGGAVWPGLRGVTYLRSHADPYCLKRDAAAWHAEVALSDFAAVAKAQGWHVPAKIVAANVGERSVSHRALRVSFTGEDGARETVAASALRFAIGRALGWNRVRSDAYELGVRNGSLVFDGHGHGHGVGLCQVGAAEMASEGKSAREILEFYFPGTLVRILPTDDGWQETRVAGFVVRSAETVTAERMAALQRIWSEAQRRFPPKQAVAPEIVYAPTTEVFRELTSQPGWALASTQGSTIVLQPEEVLHAHEADESGTLLHEILHVLVEAEAGDRAPLWLREGLVEVLAGEAGERTASMSASEIESALERADSREASERAHRAAAARVRGMVERYGISVVRGWLTSGVPAGVV